MNLDDDSWLFYKSPKNMRETFPNCFIILLSIFYILKDYIKFCS
jgi:hypothetical protein